MMQAALLDPTALAGGGALPAPGLADQFRQAVQRTDPGAGAATGGPQPDRFVEAMPGTAPSDLPELLTREGVKISNHMREAMKVLPVSPDLEQRLPIIAELEATCNRLINFASSQLDFTFATKMVESVDKDVHTLFQQQGG